MEKSFNQSLLDTPVPKLWYNKKSKVIKTLPPPLVPTEYVPQKPVPKPKTQKSGPVPILRSSLFPKPVDKENQKTD